LLEHRPLVTLETIDAVFERFREQLTREVIDPSPEANHGESLKNHGARMPPSAGMSG